MITIYYSNKLESLKKVLIELISSHKLDNPLCPEIILSENMSMMEWIYIKLAEHFSISANIKFFLPFDFIWNILNKSLWGIFPKEKTSHTIMSWILMKILLNIDNDDTILDCSIIKQYLYDDINRNKCWQLSEEIKNLFIKYFIYHQEWLFQWEQEKLIEGLDIYTQLWQSKLWRLFLKEIRNSQSKVLFFHFKYSIYEYIINFIEENNFNINKLPKRIFVYGVSYFSPILLEILQALGRYINIYIFCINPCCFFLKTNLNYHNIMHIVQRDSYFFPCISSMKSWGIFRRGCFVSNQNKIVSYHDTGNFLLSSWGNRFQEVFYALLHLEITCEYNIFIKNTDTVSLLHMLQNDILNDYSEKIYSVITPVSVKNIRKYVKNRLLYPDDHSLSIHVCHNIQREIEVLHDRLLGMISDDPLLLPHEIIVMAPNIDSYSSAIQFVFNSSSFYGRHLPFTIFDSSVSDMNVIMSSFLKLLNLSCIRFSIEEILELLSIPAVSLHFNIDEDGVKLLSGWILESGICWGLDDDIYSDVTMDINSQHTWQFGITRMLLSYAIDSTSGLWNNIFPYDVGNSVSWMELIGQLSYFLMKLKYWKTRLLKSYTLVSWLSLAEEIINDFYIINYDAETELTFMKIKYHWKKIINSGIQVNYHHPIPINILYNALYGRLHQKTTPHNFCSGGVVFCNLSSVKSIPFKVVCLLGMNINTYPMSNRAPLDFDLMKHEVRFDDSHGDCNDRYLFLEALLSAQEKLYISFVGNSVREHMKLFSSVLINELFEYIIHNFWYVEKNTRKILRITMNWIYRYICYWHTNAPFILENFISKSENQSFFKEWLPIFYNNDNDLNCSSFFSSLPKIIIDIISFNSLRNFYLHPIRAWFHNRLQIYIPKILEFPVDEPFFVKAHIKYRICNDLISFFLNKKDVNILYDQYRYSGMLPYGNFGDIFWKKQCEEMMELSRIINVYYLPMHRSDFRFSLTFENNIQLDGILNAVQKNGILRWKPGILSMQDGLLLWLEHLVYCAVGGKGESWMFGKNSFWHFMPLSDTDAKEYLLFLIFGYSHGLTIPLLLLSRSGGFWLQHCFDIIKKSISLDSQCQLEARRKLIIAWEGNEYIYGDSSDPYVSKLIPILSTQDIESIISASKKYFLLPMKFNVWN